MWLLVSSADSKGNSLKGENSRTYAVKDIQWTNFENSFGFELILKREVTPILHTKLSPKESVWLKYEMLQQLEQFVPCEQFQRLLQAEVPETDLHREMPKT